MKKSRQQVVITGDLDGDLPQPNQLSPYFALMRRYGVRGTFPATADFVESYPEVIEELLKGGHELAGHGDRHERFDGSWRGQKARLDDMRARIKQACGVTVVGFRPPWLAHNPATYQAMKEAGIEYSSMLLRKAFIHRLPPFGSIYRAPGFPGWAGLWGRISRRFYPQPPALPHWVDGIVEVPITGPDDHKLLDASGGPGFGAEEWEKVGAVWAAALDQTPGSGVFVLQAHPARMVGGFLGALDFFIGHARKTGAEFQSLHDIAAAFRARVRNHG